MKLIILFTLLPFISSFLFNPLLNKIKLKLWKPAAVMIIDKHIGNKNCSSDLKALVYNRESTFVPAIMLDAWGKTNVGILQGNFHLLGSMDSCLNINHTLDGRKIEGQYCTALLTVNDDALGPLKSSLNIKRMQEFDALPKIFWENVTFPFGMCIPKSCQIQHFKSFTSHILRRFKLPLRVTFLEDFCTHVDKPVEVAKFDFLVYFLFRIILLIVLGSTIYDIYARYSGQDLNIFIVFSAYTNLRRLLSPTKHEELSCLHGIKTLSVAWILLGHMTIFTMFISTNPFYIIKEWKYQLTSTFFTSSFYAFDTFFSISALLLTYTFLKYSERLNIGLFPLYANKIIRLMPPLAAITFVHTSVLKLWAGGPYGSGVVKNLTERCHSSWWKNLFFYTNFIEPQKMCAHHTWYLAINVQLSLLTIFILIFIEKHTRKVKTGIIVAFLSAVTYCFLITIFKELGIGIHDFREDYINYLFLSMWFYMPSWLIGVLFGYLLKRQKINISKSLNITLWVILLCIMTKLISHRVSFVEEYNVYRSALWNSLVKPLWSLAVCLVIFLCKNGYGGFVNDFLSNPVFRVIGKLTYCIYLVHISFLTVYFTSRRDMFYFTNLQVLSMFPGISVSTLICSILLYLGFEAPIVSARDFFVKKREAEINIKNA